MKKKCFHGRKRALVRGRRVRDRYERHVEARFEIEVARGVGEEDPSVCGSELDIGDVCKRVYGLRFRV
jgi:hypothetical protein